MIALRTTAGCARNTRLRSPRPRRLDTRCSSIAEPSSTRSSPRRTAASPAPRVAFGRVLPCRITRFAPIRSMPGAQPADGDRCESACRRFAATSPRFRTASFMSVSRRTTQTVPRLSRSWERTARRSRSTVPRSRDASGCGRPFCRSRRSIDANPVAPRLEASSGLPQREARRSADNAPSRFRPSFL